MSSGNPHGSWFGRLLVYLPSFLASDDKEQRGEFIAGVSRELGQASNTTWRQLVALQYLANRGVDLERLASRRSPALAAIESIARVGRINKGLEADLLADLVGGQKTVQFFVEAAKKARETKAPVPLPDLKRMPLSKILERHLAPNMAVTCVDDVLVDLAETFSIRFPGGGGVTAPARVPTPLVIVNHTVETHTTRTVVFVADHASVIAQDPDFQILFELSVLRALFSYDAVVVCANLALPSLEETRSQMRDDQFKSRLEMVFCDVDVDIRPPKPTEHFGSLDELPRRDG